MSRKFTHINNKARINEKFWQGKASPIIRGEFPQYKSHKELAIRRVNASMCGLLGILVLISLVSYYTLTSKEIKLNEIRKETQAINDENIDLQNKLDYLNSYYNVDKTMKNKNMLHRAQQVIEIPAANIPNGSESARESKNAKTSFKWSLGY